MTYSGYLARVRRQPRQRRNNLRTSGTETIKSCSAATSRWCVSMTGNFRQPSMGKHSADLQPEGYVTAWSGDLNSDLPTLILPLAVLEMPNSRAWALLTPELAVALIEGLQRL